MKVKQLITGAFLALLILGSCNRNVCPTFHHQQPESKEFVKIEMPADKTYTQSKD